MSSRRFVREKPAGVQVLGDDDVEGLAQNKERSSRQKGRDLHHGKRNLTYFADLDRDPGEHVSGSSWFVAGPVLETELDLLHRSPMTANVLEATWSSLKRVSTEKAVKLLHKSIFQGKLRFSLGLNHRLITNERWTTMLLLCPTPVATFWGSRLRRRSNAR